MYRFQPTRSPSRLLSKLVVREGLSTLLVRLYPGERGFSVALGGCGGGSKKGNAAAASGGGVTGVVLPYEQDDLLRYIDQEELPPGLGDLFERATTPIFYGGCVIAEVHDMRHCQTGHTRFVLLRPTNQSLLCDINMITREGDWTPEERNLLESQLLQATQGPLCLDPSPSVSMGAIRARQQGLQFNPASLRRVARKFSQARVPQIQLFDAETSSAFGVTSIDRFCSMNLQRCQSDPVSVSVNKKRKLDQYASQCTTPLLDFIKRNKTRNVPATASAKLAAKSSDAAMGVVEPVPLSIPDVSEVSRLARAFGPLPHTADSAPQLVEEYTLESERPQRRIYHIRLSVLQRPSSTEFLGELYVDRDYKEGVRNGSSCRGNLTPYAKLFMYCRFVLGTRAHAIRYIQQFTEIFTEEGRKSVRITRIVPGEPNRVTFTGLLRDRENAKATAQAQLANQAAAQVAAQAVAQAAAAQAAAGPITPPPMLTPIVVSVSVAPATPAATCVTTNGLPSSSQQHLQPQNLIPVMQAQAPQQTLAITNSALLAQQLQQSPIASTPMMQTSPAGASLPTSPVKSNSVSPTRHSDSAAISALVTSFMSPSPQFQQSVAMNNAAAMNVNLNNTPMVQQNQQQQHQQKIPGRKITANNLLSSRLSAPVQTVPIAPLPLQMNAPVPSASCVSPNMPPLLAQQSPQPIQLSALTSQLNAPPVIAPAQACFSLPNASNSFTYSIPNKVISSNHMVRLPVTSNVQNDANNAANRRQNNIIAEQLTSNLGHAMPGLSALLAGTPSADNPIPGVNTSSSLLERLTASSVAPQYVTTTQGTMASALPVSTPSPKPIIPSPMSSPTHQASTLSLSNLNLNVASLQGALAAIPGLQNVQVTIPLPPPIALSLNVSTPVSGQQTGVIVTTLPLSNTNTATCPSGINSVVSNLAPAQSPTQLAPLGSSPNHTMLLTNPVGVAAPNAGQMLSLPVAQAVTSGMKNALNHTQGMRTTANSVVIPQLAPGSHQQSIQLVSTLRGSPAGQVVTQTTTNRGLMQRQGTSLKVAASQASAAATGNMQATMTSSSGPVVSLTPHQQVAS
ncbi:hypothetical protein B566_EDAN009526, partial [Ephemera danica]